MYENRREFLRINAQDAKCVVKLGIGQSSGYVIDESISGIRVGGLELLMLIADQKVTVVHDGQSIVGRCRSVTRDENGLFRIGIFRESEAHLSEPRSILLNSFMNLGGCDLVCLPLAVVDEHRIRVRLMDEKEFVVRRNQIFQLTRDEREKALRNHQTLTEISNIYSLMDDSRNWATVNDILLVEFGPPLKSLASV